MKRVFINSLSVAVGKDVATICPAVTARSMEEYRKQMERLAGFVTRVHIDVADGTLTQVKLVPAKDIWWPSGVNADVHLISEEPFRYVAELLRLRPQMIVVQAEAQGNFADFASRVHAQGVAVGVALSPETPVKLIEPMLASIDHVLIVSGRLGHFGGSANMHLLTKALHLKHLKPKLEIGWDGGVDDKNIATLIASGVGVLNVGSFIQHAVDPQSAYELLDGQLKSLLSKHKQL